MSIFEALLFGLIQGLTEFIPVSSSGHLLLAHEFLGSNNDGALAFDIALHVGTLLALIVFFHKDILKLLFNLTKPNKDGRLARLLILATIPGVIFGVLLGDFVEEKFRAAVPTAIALGAVAVIMLIVDKRAKKSERNEEVTTRQGLIIGSAQVLALMPGVSRSGITMTAGILSGLDREQAARFSFLLAMPIIAGSAVGVMLKGFDTSSVGTAPLLVGMVTAFVSGMLAIRFLLKVIAQVGLKPFAYYRIALAVIVLLVLV